MKNDKKKAQKLNEISAKRMSKDKALMASVKDGGYSLTDLQSNVGCEVGKLPMFAGTGTSCAWVCDIVAPEHEAGEEWEAVFRGPDGKLYCAQFTVDDEVELVGEPKEVEQTTDYEYVDDEEVEARRAPKVEAKDASCDHMNKDGTFKGGFDGCVAHMQECNGDSEESAKKICGKIAQEVGARRMTLKDMSLEAAAKDPKVVADEHSTAAHVASKQAYKASRMAKKDGLEAEDESAAHEHAETMHSAASTMHKAAAQKSGDMGDFVNAAKHAALAAKHEKMAAEHGAKFEELQADDAMDVPVEARARGDQKPVLLDCSAKSAKEVWTRVDPLADGTLQYMPGGIHTITPSQDGEPVTVTVEVDASTAETMEKQRAAMVKAGKKPFFSVLHDSEIAAFWPSKFYWDKKVDCTGSLSEGVWVDGEWSKSGREALEGKDIRTFSPTFFVDAIRADAKKPAKVVCNEGARCNMGALENDPAFQALSPLWASRALVKAVHEVNDELAKSGNRSATLSDIRVLVCRRHAGLQLTNDDVIEALAKPIDKQ